MRQVKKWVGGLLAAALLLCAAFGVYCLDYYRMDEQAARLCADGAICESFDDYMVFRAENSDAGLVFYPGGKVECGAYAPLMEALRERGVTCVLCKMPFNLAVFKGDAAGPARELAGSVKRWYIGGHSLGGVMAADYAAKHPDSFQGLLLLASYSPADLSHSGLRVLSVYGSKDGVLNRDAYESHRGNLPEDSGELVIAGGGHAYFGCYGQQKNDGVPAISQTEQIELTAEAAAAFMK